MSLSIWDGSIARSFLGIRPQGICYALAACLYLDDNGRLIPLQYENPPWFSGRKSCESRGNAATEKRFGMFGARPGDTV